MQVSIIIVNYNTFELTCACIQSVLARTEKVSFEIILVDNASVERPAGDFLEKFPSIILVENKENLGFARGNNAGIARASGDMILLLNSDTELMNDAIAICWSFLQTQPSVGVVSAR